MLLGKYPDSKQPAGRLPEESELVKGTNGFYGTNNYIKHPDTPADPLIASGTLRLYSATRLPALSAQRPRVFTTPSPRGILKNAYLAKQAL